MWDNIVKYFQTLDQHPVERMAFLVGGLLLLWIIEGAIPFLTMQYKKNKMRHAVVNFSFTVIHLIIHTGLAILIVLLSDWCRNNQFGIVYWSNFRIVDCYHKLLLVSGFDFGGWLVHIIDAQE